MNSLKNNIVMITGATAGIGEATAKEFAAHGAHLILIGRREDRLKKLCQHLKKDHGVNCLPLVIDVRDADSVAKIPGVLGKEWRSIDILINNAGLGRGLDKIYQGNIEDWNEMLDTNVKGLLFVSRAVLPGMVERNRGHVINVGSVAGHEVYPGGNVYCATKHAVDALTNGMRIDLVDTAVRVSTVDPGLVETEFSVVRFKGDEAKAKKPYENLKPLVAEDIAEIIAFIASRPSHVNINEVIVMPKSQATATITHRVVKP